MHQINEIIQNPLGSESQTQHMGPQLTTGQISLINWFFLRLETNYGSKYWTQFSDKKTLELTKQEWAKNILAYTREELHTAIEKAKELRSQGYTENRNAIFDWPDIARILGLLKNQISPDGKNSAAYIRFSSKDHPNYQAPRLENLTQRQRREKAAADAISQMRSMFP